jgi:hypothetical protein
LKLKYELHHFLAITNITAQLIPTKIIPILFLLLPKVSADCTVDLPASYTDYFLGGIEALAKDLADDIKPGLEGIGLPPLGKSIIKFDCCPDLQYHYCLFIYVLAAVDIALISSRLYFIN